MEETRPAASPAPASPASPAAPTGGSPSPAAPRPATRRWLFRLAAVGCALLALFVVGEVAIRVSGVEVSPQSLITPGIYLPDPEVGWILKPGFTGTYATLLRKFEIRTNALGFRGHELAAEPPRHRLLVVGDSNAFGLGVADDECLPAQLERRLRAKDPTAEAVNLGVSGWNTAQEAVLLARKGLALGPSAVVLDWNTNDLDEDWQQMTLTDEGDLIKKKDLHVWEKIKGKRSAFWTRSALLTYLNVKWRIAKHRLSLRDRAETFDPDEGANGSYETNFAHIRKVRDLAKGANARFLLLVSPLRVEVESAVTGKYREKIAAFCKAEGIELIDELEALRAHWAAHAQDLFVERDRAHLNARGYEVVSEVVARWYLGAP